MSLQKNLNGIMKAGSAPNRDESRKDDRLKEFADHYFLEGLRWPESFLLSPLSQVLSWSFMSSSVLFKPVGAVFS